MNGVLWICTALSAVAALGVIAAALYSLVGRDLYDDDRGALRMCIAGPLPGLVFLGEAALRALLKWPPLPHAEYSWSFWLALLWILVGPVTFILSGFLARPFRAPWRMDALRGVLLVGWASSSFLVFVCTATIT